MKLSKLDVVKFRSQDNIDRVGWIACLDPLKVVTYAPDLAIGAATFAEKFVWLDPNPETIWPAYAPIRGTVQSMRKLYQDVIRQSAKQENEERRYVDENFSA